MQSTALSDGAAVTTLSVAHRLSTIRNVDTIFVLKEGVVCEQGSHKELMDMDGVYFDLVQLQVAGDECGGAGEDESECDPTEKVEQEQRSGRRVSCRRFSRLNRAVFCDPFALLGF